MRIIYKFRAWDVEKKQLEYRDWQTIIRFGWPLAATCNLEVMQFTGLKDKKGKEIYEADVVDTWCSKCAERHKGLVQFNNGCFSVGGIDCEDLSEILTRFISDESEIIGNIYENGDSKDNRIENLMLFPSKSEHMRYERKTEKEEAGK